jgi:hypothetical protein
MRKTVPNSESFELDMKAHAAANSSGDKIPIDLVYTYVDGNQVHAESRQRYGEPAENMGPADKGADTRFSNVGEIRFSVRSALKHMPWLRHIFIVTDAQKPPVDISFIESGKIRIVDHRDIIPARYLPTFNSITIESCLHRIDGLSGIFLYNNDDFMHFSDVPERAFLTTGNNGDVNLELNAYYGVIRRAMCFASQFLPPCYAALLANPHTRFLSNAYRLLKNSRYRFSWDEILVPRHFTNIYRRETGFRIEEAFAVQLEANRKLRFRTPECFSYSTLAYTLERFWNPGDRIRFREYPGEPARFGMYDFAALGARNDRVWRRIASSRLPFACLNSIPLSDRGTFEQVMRAKGLGDPFDDIGGDTPLMRKAD